MTIVKMPGDRSHLERLITQWAKSEPDTSIPRLRRLVGVSVFASILETINEKQNQIVLKGGTSNRKTRKYY